MFAQCLGRRVVVWWLLATTFLGVQSFELKAAEADSSKQFLTRLIWCTDKDKPAGQNLKPVPETDKVGGKIRRIFKWKNYFEVSRKIVTLPKDDNKRIRVSRRCQFIIRDIDGKQMEVKLFGDGQLAEKTVHNMATILKNGEHLIIGGDDKDNYGDAWLLVIAAAPKKTDPAAR